MIGDKQECLDTVERYRKAGVTHFIFMTVRAVLRRRAPGVRRGGHPGGTRPNLLMPAPGRAPPPGGGASSTAPLWSPVDARPGSGRTARMGRRRPRGGRLANGPRWPVRPPAASGPPRQRDWAGRDRAGAGGRCRRGGPRVQAEPSGPRDRRARAVVDHARHCARADGAVRGAPDPHTRHRRGTAVSGCDLRSRAVRVVDRSPRGAGPGRAGDGACLQTGRAVS